MRAKDTGVVLLVEDSEDDVFLMQRALKATGLRPELFVVRDGNEAVDYLSGTGIYADRVKYPFPTLVFLDLKLPYRSGADILRWMAREGILAKLFVVVLTSSEEPKDIKTAYELGAQTYLVKPPTPNMIHDIVRAFGLKSNLLAVVAGIGAVGQMGI
jgi:CheY-like chemotaxis protein